MIAGGQGYRFLMKALVRPLARDDLLRLAGRASLDELAHHAERLAWQEENRGLYLVAWRGDAVAGRATLLWSSKYREVRQRRPGCCEVNALEANPQRQGVGRELMYAAQDEVRSRGFSSLGVAVEPWNSDARMFYERLGYRDWGGGSVCDEWDEYEDGVLVRHHADICEYLVLAV